MRIVLAEDAPQDERMIREFTHRFFAERNERAELVVYEDGARLLSDYPQDADMFLLDIEMPHVDGLQVAKAVRLRDGDVPICFVTSLGHLAPEGYTVDAVGFMIKPLAWPSFRSTMERIVSRIEYRRRRLVGLREGKGERFVDVRSIACVESLNKRTIVHLLDGSFTSGESLKSIEARLSSPAFFRVHNAFLVNLEHVETVVASDVVVLGRAIPISKHRRRDFLRALTLFVGRHA